MRRRSIPAASHGSRRERALVVLAPEVARRVLAARAVAVGPPLAADVVRAILLARVSTMATGGSGVSLAVLETLVATLNTGVEPIVPRWGAIGAADLGLLATLALPLLGHGALVLRAALDAITIAATLSMDAFRANPAPLDPRAQTARPAPGQREMADRLRALLDGSDVWRVETARSVQDPISFRCVSQIHGAALAQGFDLVAIALAYVASAAAERVIKLLTPAPSGLPLNLTRHGPSQTGFATVQKTITALAAEMRHLAQPGSLDFTPVSAGIEDHASNAVFTVAKAAEAVEPLSYVTAAELLVAAQAVELRARELGAPLNLGRGPRAALTAVRGVVPPLDDDRPPGSDIERVRGLLRSGIVG